MKEGQILDAFHFLPPLLFKKFITSVWYFLSSEKTTNTKHGFGGEISLFATGAHLGEGCCPSPPGGVPAMAGLSPPSPQALCGFLCSHWKGRKPCWAWQPLSASL